MSGGAWLVAAQLVGAVLASTGLVKAIEAFTRRGTSKAEAGARVNEMTLEWATALKADADAAHDEVREVRAELRTARNDLSRLTDQIQAAMLQMGAWQRAIWARDASIDALRVIVPEPGRNGHQDSLEHP